MDERYIYTSVSVDKQCLGLLSKNQANASTFVVTASGVVASRVGLIRQVNERGWTITMNVLLGCRRPIGYGGDGGCRIS